MLTSKQNSAYIIAEVGQNHQGDFDLAKRYIEEFAKLGADAIKFQKRDLKTLFEAERLDRSYESDNAFGTTYGEHRETLEFSVSQMRALKMHCDEHDVDFMCTAFDHASLDALADIECSKIKLASFDMGNIALITAALETSADVILSSGGSDRHIIEKTCAYFKDKFKPFTLLHCVSKYPCEAEELRLELLVDYQQRFPWLKIGLSDHFSGPLSGPVGAVMGAQVFEKHVTFNRAWRGTDHPFALSPTGFSQFVKDINRASKMIAPSTVEPAGLGQEPVFRKLGKSLVARKTIAEGEVFSTDNLTGRIIEQQDCIPVREMVNLIGSTSQRSYREDEPINEIVRRSS